MKLTKVQKSAIIDDVRRIYPALTRCKQVVVDGARILDVGELNAEGISVVTISVSVKVRDVKKSEGIRAVYMVYDNDALAPAII